jgi:hypothetical protein
VAPDSASFDFALVRGPGHTIATTLSNSAFSRNSESATVHVRVWRPEKLPLGAEILANGRPVRKHLPEDPASFPPYLSFSVSGDALAEAEKSGMRIEIKSIGPPAAESSFLYFPVIPSLLDGQATIDGSPNLPSGYVGITSGGLPIWVHPGTDPQLRTPSAP